ncbi:MAG: translesion DNA synthesis-associated protein ImuA [Burkholderiales bacterium]
MAIPLPKLLRHPAIWRVGDVQPAARAGIPTGYAVLDRELPEAGWPAGALTELLTHEAIGELSLITPALRAITEQGKHIALIASPYLPYARALEAAGLPLPRVLLVDVDELDALWAAEQALRSGACGMVALWAMRGRSPDYRSLQRLHGAAAHGGAACVLYRGPDTRTTPSPAPLRLALHARGGRLDVEILKRRGALSARPVVLTPFPLHWIARSESSATATAALPSVRSATRSA